MKFCIAHWEKLRQAIKDRDLYHLVKADGQKSAEALRQEIEAGHASPATFDPLMSAHMAILANTLSLLNKEAPSSVTYLLQGEDVPEDLCDLEGNKGRTWPRCPVCYLNLAHELTCEGCSMPKENGFDWMIERAADEQVERWEELKVEGNESG